MPTTITSFSLDPAERVDVIVDFSNLKDEIFTLINTDAEADENTSIVMQFRVTKELKCKDKSEIPQMLRHMPALKEEDAHVIRTIPITPGHDHFGRPMLMMNNKMWSDPVTEMPVLDTIEVWNIVNAIPVPHPIHLHLIQFKLISRTPFDRDKFNKTGKIVFIGKPESPKDYEKGFKDTIDAPPGMVTKFIVHFTGYPGEYVWHCHFLEHEDHDMMRPMKVLDNSYQTQCIKN